MNEIERKLELKDVSGYLPYELRALNKCKNSQAFGTFVHAGLGSIDYYISRPDKFNIILRPISDLYRPIIHNGKEIIPIVELAHIGSYFNSEVNWQQEGLCAILGNWHFYYESFIRGFVLENNNTFRIVYNQYQLFDYLHELKIDYRGLIDAKLAVSVYDLDTNPYK